MDNNKIVILHCITSLCPDGAQRMLYRLLLQSDRSQFDMRVLNLSGPSEFSQQFERAGIPVYHLNMPRGLPTPAGLIAFYRVLKEVQPDILQGWMYHGNLAAYFGRMVTSAAAPVFWNIRRALYSRRDVRRKTALMLRLGAMLSSRVQGILYCGEFIAEQHEIQGYCPEKRIVIANGFDASAFAPSQAASAALRAELGLGEHAPIIGIVGRALPDKDHENFLQAAGALVRRGFDAHFVLVGRGVDSGNIALSQLAAQQGIADRCYFLGERSDIAQLMPAFDVFCLSSKSEGFPNVVAEAMLSGLPCVVTAAGATAEVVGDTGILVPRKNFRKLAAGLEQVLSMKKSERVTMGEKARQRVVKHFSIPVITRQYEVQYIEALAKPGSGQKRGDERSKQDIRHWHEQNRDDNARSVL